MFHRIVPAASSTLWGTNTLLRVLFRTAAKLSRAARKPDTVGKFFDG
jgi:hypothetical protein